MLLVGPSAERRWLSLCRGLVSNTQEGSLHTANVNTFDEKPDTFNARCCSPKRSIFVRREEDARIPSRRRKTSQTAADNA